MDHLKRVGADDGACCRVDADYVIAADRSEVAEADGRDKYLFLANEYKRNKIIEYEGLTELTEIEAR